MLKTLGGLVVVVGVLVYLTYGTLSPCDAYRETVRRQDGLARILPNALLDAAIESKVGALSPGKCISLLIQTEKPAAASSTPAPAAVAPPQATIPQQPQEPMIVAQNEMVAAINECRNKRIDGTLKTYVASAQCSNPRIIQAFSKANYRYMDLVAALAAKRVELSERIDRKQVSEADAQVENQKLFAAVIEAEKQRDSIRK